ncbi:MAG: Uma2 family endonuclease [Campylobacterota bacterium]|nr:Uma2 family endonuclease [Campylobacterota bacterium]
MEALKLENYTYQDYLDIDRTTKENEMVELIFGEIYMNSGASAKHQDAVFNLAYYLKQTSKKDKCKPRIAPYDIKLKNKDDISVVQPDVMIICQDLDIPCAVFEVLSPSTASKDKGVKKELYELSGIKEYYIINIELKIIDKYILDNKKYYYIKGYSLNDTITIDCVEVDILVDDIFKDIG